MDKNRYIKVENQPHLVRDKISGAILNTDVSEIKRAKEIKRKNLLKEQEISEMKSDISELKQLVKLLVVGYNNPFPIAILLKLKSITFLLTP